MGTHGKDNLKQKFQPAARQRKGKHYAVLAWNVVPAYLLGLFVQLMDDGGRAILLGRTTSGDVLSVIVYDDGDREKFYVRNNAEVSEGLASIIEYYDEDAAQVFRETMGTRNAAQPTPAPNSTEKTAKTV